MKKKCTLIAITFLLVMVVTCEATSVMKELKKKSEDSNWKIMMYYQYNPNFKKELHLLDGTLTDTSLAYGDIYNPQTKHLIEGFFKIADKDPNHAAKWIRFCDLYGKVMKEFPLDPNYIYTALLAVAPNESELIFGTMSGIIKFEPLTLKTERFNCGGLKAETIEYSSDGSYLLIGCTDANLYTYEYKTGKLTPLGKGYFPKWNAGYDGVIYTKDRDKKYVFEKNIKTLEERSIPFYPEVYSPDREYYLHYKVPFWQFMTENINVYVSPSKVTGKKNAVYIGGQFSRPRPNGCIWIAE